MTETMQFTEGREAKQKIYQAITRHILPAADDTLNVFFMRDVKNEKLLFLYVEVFDKKGNLKDYFHFTRKPDGTVQAIYIGTLPKTLPVQYVQLSNIRINSKSIFRIERCITVENSNENSSPFKSLAAQFMVQNSKLNEKQKKLVAEAQDKGQTYGEFPDYNRIGLLIQRILGKHGISKVIVTQNAIGTVNNVHVMHYKGNDVGFHSNKFHSDVENATIPEYHLRLFSYNRKGGEYDSGKHTNFFSWKR